MKTSLIVLVAASFVMLSCGNTKKMHQENSETPAKADGKPFLFGSLLMQGENSSKVEDWPSATDDGILVGRNCNINNQGRQCGSLMVGGQPHCFSCPANSHCWPKVPATEGWDCVGNCRGANTIQCGVNSGTGEPECCTAPKHCTANVTTAPPSASCGTDAGNGPTCTGDSSVCRNTCPAPQYLCGNPGVPRVDNMCCTPNDVCTQVPPSSNAQGAKFACLNNLNPGYQPSVTCGGPGRILNPGNVCCIIQGVSFWQCPSTMGCSSPLVFDVCGIGTTPFPNTGKLCNVGSLVWTCPVKEVCGTKLDQCFNPTLLSPPSLPRPPLGGPGGFGSPY